MLELIIPAVIIVVIMFSFAIFMLKNIVKRINQNTKKYFVDKLQDFDYMIAEKEKEIEILNKQIEKLRKAKENSDDEVVVQVHKRQEPREQIVYDIPTPQYREETFFRTYKTLNKEFDINDEKVLKQFIKEHKSEYEEEYQLLQNFKNYFTKNAIYECLTLTSEEQLDLVKSVMNEKDKRYIEPLIQKIKVFSVVELLEQIKERMDKINPTIYVYVGRENVNYDYLGSNIKTKLFKNMSKGIMIEYQDKIYDYSI